MIERQIKNYQQPNRKSDSLSNDNNKNQDVVNANASIVAQNDMTNQSIYSNGSAVLDQKHENIKISSDTMNSLEKNNSSFDISVNESAAYDQNKKLAVINLFALSVFSSRNFTYKTEIIIIIKLYKPLYPI